MQPSADLDSSAYFEDVAGFKTRLRSGLEHICNRINELTLSVKMYGSVASVIRGTKSCR